MNAAAAKLREWRGDPVQFVRENFHVEPEPWQADYLMAYAQTGKKRIGAQAAVGVGKSAVKAWCAWHFLSTVYDPTRHPGKHPVGYALSISADNLASGLWKELAVWRARSPFLMSEFEWTAEKVFHRSHPATWWIKARSYSKSANPEVQGAALSGLHGPYILGLLDEIGEMHPAIGRRAEQLLSDAECEVGAILASGNPTSTSGLLYEVAQAGSGWQVIRITGDPADPKCSNRTDKAWAAEQIAKHGRDNPWVMSHILGLFPPGGLNTLLSPDEVRSAMERNPQPDTYEWSQKRLGIDVARFGGDRTVLFPRQGLVAFRPTELRHQDTNFIAAKALSIVNSWQAQMVMIDDTGHWGHGVVDNLLAAGVSAIPVNFADRKVMSPQYFNRRTEMWFETAEWIKRGGALPNIPELIAELSTPTYFFQDGKVRLIEKDQIKETLGRSPDLADALALTFAIPDQPAGFTMEEALSSNRLIPGYGGGNIVRDYDPFDPRRNW
jgi:hypothetical protein